MAEQYRFGNVEVAVAIDTEGAMPTTRFFPHIPAQAWEPYRHLLTSSGRIRARIVSFVLRSQGQTILVDTGVGLWDLPGYGNGRLLDSLGEMGIQPEDIDIVLATHLHIDHTGWNTRPTPDGPVPTFPRARYLFQRADWDHFTSPESLARGGNNVQNAVLPLKDSGQMELMDGELHVTSDVTLIHSPGHTPGHVAVLIQSLGEAAVILGDVCHHPAQITETDWSPNADLDPALSARTRRALVERAKQLEAMVGGAHFNTPAFGRLVEIDGRSVWQGAGADD
jgi:glyoxylase-like metal-dependent hydrolase (beta-lactamase superfamily II)